MKILYTILITCFFYHLQGQSYDLAIATPNPNGATLMERGNIIRLGGNFYCPVRLMNHYLVDVNWGARVVNYSATFMTNTWRPRLQLQLYSKNNGWVFYRDSIEMNATDTLMNNDSIGYIFQGQLSNIDAFYSFHQITSSDTIIATYWIEHDGIELDRSNDSIAHYFILEPLTNVTRQYYTTPNNSLVVTKGQQYISKVRLSPVDGKVQATTAYFPDTNPLQSLRGVELGSLFYFPDANVDSLHIDSIDFRYYIDSSFAGDSVQYVLTNIYLFEDGRNGGVSNGVIEHQELTQVGIALDSILGLGTNIPKASYGVVTTTCFVNAGTGVPLRFFPNYSFILVSVQLLPEAIVSNPPTFLSPQNSIMFGMDSVNYALNNSQSSPSSPFATTFQILVDSAYPGTISPYAGNGDLALSIGLHLDYSTTYYGLLNTKSITNSSPFQLQLSPNPTSDLLQLQVETTGPTTTSSLQYIITNSAGQVIYYNHKTATFPVQETINVSNWPAGVYVVTIKNEVGTSSQSFIKE